MKKFKNFRIKAMVIFLVCAAILTACGSKESAAMNFAATQSQKGFASDYAYDNAASDDGYYSEYSSDEAYEMESGSDSTVNAAAIDEAKNSGLTAEAINREMLVYSCTMNVDVLDFEKATEEFRAKMTQYQAFTESEQLSDGGSSGIWYDKNEDKWHTYTATIRVPSRVYDDFCNAVSELGDLRSKNASVENVSQEYSDLSTTLKIYEQKEERYLQMLADAKDEVNAVAIEEKLTDIQVEIAKIKTRMNQIKTDVAYSYVYVTIREVKEYQEEPVYTDTFLQRLGNTLSRAGKGFLSFLEGLLFALIYLFPYLLLIALALFAVIKTVRAVKKSSAKKAEKRAAKAKAENAADQKTEAENSGEV